MRELPATLVLVPDYQSGERSWDLERRALRAHLSDAAGAPRRVLVIAPMPGDAAPVAIPDDIARLAPRVRVEFVPSTSSKVLKNAAVELCDDDIIAVADADCLPGPGWLAHLVGALQDDPDLGVVSSLTTYPDRSSLARAASVLQRGYLEHAALQELDVVSVNGAAFRRRVLEAHPFPTDQVSSFLAGELRNQSLRRAGVRARVVADATMLHAFEGWSFVMDFHRNKGFQAATRYLDGGVTSITKAALLALRLRVREDWEVVRTIGPRRLRTADWATMLALFLVVRVPELVAALRAHDSDASFRARTHFQ